MLSRRNIRIKVLQLLYALDRDSQLSPSEAMRQYSRSITNSYTSYLFSLAQLIQVARYATEYKKYMLTKLVLSQEDKDFSDKLSTNELVRSVVSNEYWEIAFRNHHLKELLNDENTKKLYLEFSQTGVYRDYLNNKKTTNADHTKILLELYKFIRSRDVFSGMVDDYFFYWEEDSSLVAGAVKRTIKELPVSGNFLIKYKPDDETTKAFGEALLKTIIQKDGEFLETITPNLKNWDADRIAVIDMIIIKMAMAEFMFFESIPTRVTLNEYVEMAKNYSTDNSKDFINGILDKILKQLSAEGKINKSGRGLID